MSGIPCDARGCRAVATQQRITTIATGGYDGPIAREVQTDLCDAHAAEHDAQAMARSLVEGRVPEAPSAGMAREAAAIGRFYAQHVWQAPPAVSQERIDAFMARMRPIVESACREIGERAELNARAMLPARGVASDDDRRELLADLAHRQWSGWMEYLFAKSQANQDGTVTIPAWAVERWKRQIATPYADLEEGEQESDRAEADRVLTIVGGA